MTLAEAILAVRQRPEPIPDPSTERERQENETRARRRRQADAAAALLDAELRGRVARRVRVHSDEVDELVQRMLVRLMKSRSSFSASPGERGDGMARAWLAQAMRWERDRLWKQHGRRPTTVSGGPQEPDPLESIADGDATDVGPAPVTATAHVGAVAALVDDEVVPWIAANRPKQLPVIESGLRYVTLVWSAPDGEVLATQEELNPPPDTPDKAWNRVRQVARRMRERLIVAAWDMSESGELTRDDARHVERVVRTLEF